MGVFSIATAAALCSVIFAVAMVQAAPGSGRVFKMVTAKAALSSCPSTNQSVNIDSLDNDTVYIIEQRSLNNQTEANELQQLMYELQVGVNQQKLTFNVSETNRQLNLTQPPDARQRLCPPIFDVNFVQLRVPRFLITVSCSPGCEPVTRDVQVFDLLCAAGATGGAVFYSKYTSLSVDCTPVRLL